MKQNQIIVTAGIWGTVYGMRFTRKDRDNFDRSWGGIVVEVGGKKQAFAFSQGFWNKCPEFRDHGKPTLENWLKSEGLIPWPKGKPPKFVLEPLGGNEFRLKRV